MNEIPVRVARKWAEKIVEELRPFCYQIEIAGSIRRNQELVHDVDIVALPSDKDGFKKRALERCRCIENGEKHFVITTENGAYIDTYFARERVDTFFGIRPTNFGSLLICRTGSREHNIWLIHHARSIGLEWRPYYGVYRGHDLLASESEHAIFEALELDYIPPERRER